MSEADEEADQRALRELEGKNVAHYSVLLSAWIQTRMERDKTLVTLSAAAIGLLVTILTTVGARSTWEIPLYGVSVVSFLVTIWSALVVYQLNSEHIEHAIQGGSERDPRLKKYDKRSLRAFVTGCVSALFIAIVSASFQISKAEEHDMSRKNRTGQGAGEKVHIKKSVDGVTSLNPNRKEKKSLDGITDLKPKPTEQSTPSQQPQDDSSTQGAESGSDSTDGGD